MSDALWTVAAMADAMNGHLVGVADAEPASVTGISIDTRSLQHGEAYFAIKGDVHDGHKFVAAAHAAGAAISVVSEEWVSKLEGETGPLLVVDDVLAGLEKLGLAARARSSAKIVAITGSVGKTSTKEAVRTALSACGSVHASAASFNNHWGVPLTLARMSEDVDFGVFEIGMNHPNEISPLVKMVQPNVAVINNVAAVHLGAFDSVDGIARAKAEIFDGLVPGGTAVLNADDERFELQKTFAKEAGVANIVSFGEAEGADVRLTTVKLHGSCSCLSANVLGEDMMVKVGIPGRHMAQNALAVLAIVKLFGADLAQAGMAMAATQAVKGRGQRHKLKIDGGAMVLIDESYNANPTSMSAALALLGSAATQGAGRRIAVLGDMLELGPQSKDFHAGLADAVLSNSVDLVFCVGPEMAYLHTALSGKVACEHALTIEDLLPSILEALASGDVLMAKASLGMRFAILIDHLLQAYGTADTSNIDG
ncbi:MAG: UDP-N-acetylmuramoylalanyl-D-glutamyl-2,6-diaminopimelate--D-alanyl-D-alanine ligase [Pseudomonadota bacterium]